MQIDGKVINTVFAPPGGFGSLEDLSEGPNPWKGASKFAPFDQEVQWLPIIYLSTQANLLHSQFYVAFGVGVGGIHDFPDNCVNHGKSKPWRNGQPKVNKYIHEVL